MAAHPADALASMVGLITSANVAVYKAYSGNYSADDYENAAFGALDGLDTMAGTVGKAIDGDFQSQLAVAGGIGFVAAQGLMMINPCSKVQGAQKLMSLAEVGEAFSAMKFAQRRNVLRGLRELGLRGEDARLALRTGELRAGSQAEKVAAEAASGAKSGWLARREAGNVFNREQAGNYPFNELYVERAGGGHHVRFGFIRTDGSDCLT